MGAYSDICGLNVAVPAGWLAHSKQPLQGGYATTGHGGNRELRASNPANLRFSILQLTSPDLPAGQVVALEDSWKQRLHTREFGLNRN